MRSKIKLIAFDADDTLWVNEPFYSEGEKRLEEIVRKYARVDSITNSLYETELKNLSLFGYGSKGFTISMIETAIQLTSTKIKASEVQDARFTNGN